MRKHCLKVFLAILIISFYQNNLKAQNINWANVSSQQKQLIHANFGAEFGVILGLGYHYLLCNKIIPLYIGGEFSTPFGITIADDYKTRIGVQIRIFKLNNFQLSGRIQGVARHYQSNLIQLFNFGSDVAGTIGYYRKHFFLAGEVGFDKAIVTNFEHSVWYKNNIYSEVQNGWFQPATGGNFYYGLQGGYSTKKIDLTLKGGKVLQQDYKTKPLLPIYAQIGINYKF